MQIKDEKYAIINHFRLFEEHAKRRSPQLVVVRNNKRIEGTIRKLQEMYFPASVLYDSRRQRKFMRDADTGRDPRIIKSRKRIRTRIMARRKSRRNMAPLMLTHLGAVVIRDP